MKNYYVTRDRFSWRWKDQPSVGWNFFNDSVVDQKTMKNYLTLNQRFNPVSLSFVDDNLRPANIFEIRRQDGKIKTTMNAGEREFILHDWDLIDSNELLRYFHDRQTNEINEQANKVDGVLPRVEFYKANTDQVTKESYKTMLSERMNDSAIKNYLKDYEPGKISEIHFVDDSATIHRPGYH